MIEKMTEKIKQWSTKQVSYAGRLILIDSVLMLIHAYWSQIMVLPRKMTKEISRVCRAFLWSGKEESMKPGAVAWGQICKARNFGGLGIKNVEL